MELLFLSVGLLFVLIILVVRLIRTTQVQARSRATKATPLRRGARVTTRTYVAEDVVGQTIHHNGERTVITNHSDGSTRVIDHTQRKARRRRSE